MSTDDSVAIVIQPSTSGTVDLHKVITLGWKASGMKLLCVGLWLNAFKSESHMEAMCVFIVCLPTNSREPWLP